MRLYPPWSILKWYGRYARAYPKAFDIASLNGPLGAFVSIIMAIGVIRRIRGDPPSFGAEAWMIPKGLIERGEEAIEAARREFAEENGLQPPALTHALTALRQAGGKTVLCWAAEGDLDFAAFKPGDFEMEWPPRSGRRATFPELDRVAYFDGVEALTRILPSQAPLIVETLRLLGECA